MTKTVIKAITPVGHETLDELRCGCGQPHPEIIFRSQCHPDAPVVLWYNRDERVVYAECVVCSRRVVTVLVATESDSLEVN